MAEATAPLSTDGPTSQTVRPPHLQVFDFLGPDRNQTLINHVAEHLDSMEPSSVAAGGLIGPTYDATFRKSRVDSTVEQIWPLFEKAITPMFPHLRRELGTGYFALGSIERQLTVHTDGDFFATHVDEPQPLTDGCRMITYVYYFNAEPKEFDGGMLRLYDSAVGPDGIRRAAETYTDIEPTNNSIVFFSADSFHEVLPVRQIGDGAGALRCTVNGWFHAGDLGRPRAFPFDADVLTAVAGRILPHVSDAGFTLRPTPESVHNKLVSFWTTEQSGIRSESAPPTFFPEGSPDFLPLGDLGTEVLGNLHDLHEHWAGTTLRPVAAYGMRIFRRGQTERLHIERPETHVISSMLVIDQDLDTPWPITLDLKGRRHELRPQPGHMLLYEGATTPQAHPVPLDGSSYVIVLLHYCPVDWPHSPESIMRAAAAKGWIDGTGKLQPEFQAGT